MSLQPLGRRLGIAPYFSCSNQYGEYLRETPGNVIWWAANGSAYWKYPLEPGPAAGYAVDIVAYRRDVPTVFVDGRPVIIGDLDIEFDVCAPYWNRVIAIYMTDELRASSDVNKSAADIKQRLERRGLPQKPLLANQTVAAFDLSGFPAPPVIPVIEAFILGAPQNTESATAVLRALLERIVPAASGLANFTDAARPIALSCMTFDRGGTWANEDSLVAIQSIYLDACRKWPNIVGLMPFAAARPDGMLSHPRLVDVWRDIVAAVEPL